MTEREKVIKGLELCLTPTESHGCDDVEVCHTECPYFRAYNMGDCIRALAKDALALLKAQEPVEPKEVIYDDEHRSVYCPNCDNRLAGLTNSGAVALETEETPNYCWMCGQAVKWG